MKHEEFKKELRSLLEKYEACISAEVGEGSDTHGIFDEGMAICIGRDNKFHHRPSIVIEGWIIDHKNI